MQVSKQAASREKLKQRGKGQDDERDRGCNTGAGLVVSSPGGIHNSILLTTLAWLAWVAWVTLRSGRAGQGRRQRRCMI
ncbi:hypothetical protein I7I50_00084 [Histoplasma capsulatum G186AR]|uniref:Uncharacterized protein n=1 Tax=Ajellomyces capsulatus TaxID=5037 RepID=A0A8H8CVJ4_AJECA|nr:hypothetical protein I7I52_07353 [Histoplasma capsulatum]QSS72285.1 hypothetical protein I7I50_00084 [Histoplasma capsulatum G186AR]